MLEQNDFLVIGFRSFDLQVGDINQYVVGHDRDTQLPSAAEAARDMLKGGKAQVAYVCKIVSVVEADIRTRVRVSKKKRKRKLKKRS